VSFTGETFNETVSHPSTEDSPCYPKINGETWSSMLTYLYIGTDVGNCRTGVALNYDAHPGYDYKASYGTPVKAAASGTIVNFLGQKCIPKGISSCSNLGAVGIKHSSGYVTQYLHLSAIGVNAGNAVTKGQVIGYSGNTGTAPYHLHFEVLKQVPGSSGTSVSHYKVVDPYGWTGGGTDPLEVVTGIKNACLWQSCK